jgi:hypothetical protein
MVGSVFVSPRPLLVRGCSWRQPGGDQAPSPANLIDANRPRGLTRVTLYMVIFIQGNSAWDEGLVIVF